MGLKTRRTTVVYEVEIIVEIVDERKGKGSMYAKQEIDLLIDVHRR